MRASFSALKWVVATLVVLPLGMGSSAASGQDPGASTPTTTATTTRDVRNGERDQAAGDKLYERALRYTKRRNYTKALEMFEKALPYRSGDANIYFNMVAVSSPLKAWRKVVLYGAGFLYLETEPSKDRTDIVKAVNKASRMLRSKPRMVVFDFTPKGTEVRLGYVPVGRAKGAAVAIPPGQYTAHAQRADYEPMKQSVTVIAGEGTQKLSLNMIKKIYFGTLTIATTPAEGVVVSIDGKVVGTTPLKAALKLETRRYLVKFSKPGFDVWQRYVTIDKDLPQKLSPMLERSR